MNVAERNTRVLLPTEIALEWKREAWTPERRLMAAVLEEAVNDYRTAALQIGRLGGHRAEIHAWFASNDARRPFSFLAICHALDLDPSSVRAALARPSHRGGTARRLVVGGNG